jgi:ATP adenylyltransferase
MAYIKAPKGTARGCVFCAKVRAPRERDRENLVLFRGKRAFIVLNLYPYTNGHVMVLPYRHTGELDKLDTATLQEMMQLVNRCLRALRKMFKPEGFNIGVNMGKAAGAGVAEHVHIHVLPRWSGDTDFLGTTADIRKIPELLPDTYEKLLAALHADAHPPKPKRPPAKSRK